MGAFSSLRHPSLGGAVKQFKYKQGVMLDHIQGHVDEEQYQVSLGGVCCALTMNWLAQRFGTIRGRFGAGRERFEKDLAIMKHNVAMYNSTRKIFNIRGKEVALRALAKVYDLEFSQCEYSHLVRPLADLLADLDYQAKLLGDSFYISIGVKNAAREDVGPHAIGIAGDYAHDTSFLFDPNVGEYEITDVSKFTKNYLASYGASGYGWHLEHSFALAFEIKKNA